MNVLNPLCTILRHVAIVVCIHFLTGFNVNAQSISHLLRNKTGGTQPHLVIHVLSNDCIMCRGSVLNLMEQIKYKEKTTILFDDSVMQLFVDKNPEKFKNFKLVFDKQLSDKLTPDQLSSAYIITDTGMRKFIIKTITPENIDLLNTTLATGHTVQTSAETNTVQNANNPHFKNITYYNGLGNGGFIASASSSLLFNDHVQIGYYKEMDKEGVFIEPGDLDKTENILLPMVQARYHHRLVSDTLKKLALSATAISPIVLMGLENNNGEISGVVRLNIVRNKSPEGDTNMTIGVTGYYFLGIGSTRIIDALSPSRYTQYYLLDTFHFSNQYLQANPTFGCHKAGNKIYFQVYDININGRDKMPRQHYLAEMLLDNGKTSPTPLKLYKMGLYDKNPTENFLFTTDEEGGVLIAYKNMRTLINYKDNKEINFDALLGKGYENAVLNDLKIKNGVLETLFLKDEALVLSTYNLKTGKKHLKTISQSIPYTGARYTDNGIRMYRKDTITGMYTFLNI